MNPDSNQPNWEEMLARFRRPGSPQRGNGNSVGNPWQGGLAQLRDRFTRGRNDEAITNPGSLAASQGAPTSSGITAPGAATGAPASPTNANPHAPANRPPANRPPGQTHAQQLIQALRARRG